MSKLYYDRIVSSEYCLEGKPPSLSTILRPTSTPTLIMHNNVGGGQAIVALFDNERCRRDGMIAVGGHCLPMDGWREIIGVSVVAH